MSAVDLNSILFSDYYIYHRYLPDGKSVLRLIRQPSGCATINTVTSITVGNGQASDASQPTQASTFSLSPQVLSPKKCVWREPCDSLSDVFCAALKSSALLPSTISQRNSCLTAQLTSKWFNVIGVVSDGICLLRALYNGIHGHQSVHA